MAKRITVLIGLAFLLAFIVPNIINADDQLSIIDAKAKYASITRTTPQEFEVITTLDVQYLMLYAEDGKTLVRTYGVTGNSVEKDGRRVWTVSHTIKDAGSRKLVFKGGTTNATPSTNSVIVPFKVEKTGVISASAKYEAIRMRTAQEFTVQTTSDANYLVEYAEDGKTKVKTWTASSSNSVVSGNVRTWTVTQTIQDPGKRNLFFRAGTTSTPTSAQKSAAFRVEDTWVIEATAQTATIGKGGKQTFIVKTSSNAQYLMLYGEGKNLVKTWAADSTNSVLENDVRTWDVDLAINTAGNRELVIKSGKTQSPSELSGAVVFKVADKTVLNASALLPSITKTSAQEFEVLTTADVQYLMLYAENGTPLVKTWAASGNSVETEEKFRIWTISLAINTPGNRNLIFKGGTTSKTPVTNAVSVPFKVESTGVISASAKYESIPRKTEQEFTIQTTSDAIYLVEYAEDGKTKIRTWTASSDNSSVSGNIRTWTVKQTIQDPGKRSLVFRAGNTSTPSSAQRVANFEVLPYVEISIIAQPTSVITEAGSVVEYTIAATGNGTLTYQWQSRIDEESAWEDLTGNGAETATLSVEGTKAQQGSQFRCVVTDSAGKTATSDTATLTISPLIITQPESIIASPESAVEFSIEASGTGELSYQWQYRENEESEWKAATQSGAKTETLTLETTADLNGWQFRCVVTDESGRLAYSDGALLTISPIIISQPKNEIVASGSSAQFTVEATGSDELTYQWQSRKDTSSAWVDSALEGADSATFTVVAFLELQNYQFRCMVSDGSNRVAYSEVAELFISPVIISQPITTITESGTIMTYTVEADGMGELSYQWQYRKNTTAEWEDVTQDGANTSVFSFEISEELQGYQFRCVVADDRGNTEISDPVSFSIGPVINVQPKDSIGALGSRAYFSVEASGIGRLTYQWQYRYDEQSAWSDYEKSGARTDTIPVLRSSQTPNGMQFRCGITDDSRRTVYSEVATLSISPLIIQQPIDINLYVPSPEFTLEADGIGDVQFQWQYRMDSSHAWENATLVGADTRSLFVAEATELLGYQFRCIVTDGDGRKAYSNACVFSRDPVFGIQPQDVYTTEDSEVIFMVEAYGAGDLSYQWQSKNAVSSVWRNCSQETAEDTVLSIQTSASLQGNLYRCVVTDGNGNQGISNEVSLIISPLITKQPQDVAVELDSITTFSLEATGISNLVYQWQYRANPSASWEASTINGSDSSSISVTASLEYNGYQFRCMVEDIDGRKAYSNIVTVMNLPSITMQPLDICVAEGATAEFQVVANGSEHLSYQWQAKGTDVWSEWVNITDENGQSSLLSIRAASLLQGYMYRCIIMDGNGNYVISNAVALTISPLITQQPQDVNAEIGTDAEFSVEATGNTELTYQWQYKTPSSASWIDYDSDGSDSSRLTITAQVKYRGYQFRCVVTDGIGNQVITNSVKLTVLYDSVPIDENNFPDAAFRNYLSSQYDKNGDGIFSTDELQSVSSISVSKKNISNLKGIEFFTALTRLDCDNTCLTKFDVSGCTSLQSLHCYNNTNLTDLDVSGCTSLQSLSCNNNTSLTNLDVSGCTSLQSLSCDNTNLTNLDVSGCISLLSLSCSKNTSLTDLDVSGCTSLQSLYCYNNTNLTDLDVSGYTSLQTLSCYDNNMTDLDVSGCEALLSVECYGNKLTSLDFNSCTSLQRVDCRNNSLTSLNVSGCGSLVWLICMDNQLTDLEVSNCTLLQTLACGGNQLTELNLSALTALGDLGCGENNLSELDLSSNTALYSLDCHGNNLTELNVTLCYPSQPYYEFAYASQLNCADNELTRLDLSGCSYILELNCSGNKLTSLDVSPCSYLQQLFCGNNKLTSLTGISDKSGLRYLDCSENHLSSLSLPENSQYLQGVSCAFNDLTSLTISHLAYPSILDCSANRLSSLNLGDFRVSILNCSSNQLSSLNCSVLESNSVLICTNNNLKSLDLSCFASSECFSEGYLPYAILCDEYVEILDQSLPYRYTKNNGWYTSTSDLPYQVYVPQGSVSLLFPDPTFREIIFGTSDRWYPMYIDLKQLSFITDLALPYDDSAPVYTAFGMISPSGKKVRSLRGIEWLPLLTHLECANQELTNLNVSANTNLISLDCHGNNLERLIVNNNPKLRDLNCSDNNLTTLDVSANPDNTLWTFNNDYYNGYYYNMNSYSSALYNLDCSKNSISTLLLTGANSLGYLKCTDNDLTQLDLSTNHALSTLDCDPGIVCFGGFIPINEQIFPDAVFRQMILYDYDKDRDGILNPREICGITSLRVNQSVTDLSGIENLTLLEILNCEGAKINSLDLRKNKQLKELNCRGTGLQSLDLSENKELKILICDPETTVIGDIKSEMESIPIYEEFFPDESFMEFVSSLDTNNDGLLSYQERIVLNYVYLTDRNISSLKGIEFFPNITTIDCSYNNLNTLDVSKNTNLQWLRCDYNELTDLNLSLNPELTYLSCCKNKINTLNIGSNIQLEFLCDDSVRVVTSSRVIPISSSFFPDTDFRNYVTTIDLDHDGMLSQSERSSVTWLSYSGKSIRGIEFITGIMNLNIGINYVDASDLNLCERSDLCRVSISYTNMNSLNLSGCTAMEDLSVQGDGNIEYLDVSGCTSIRYLYFGYNSPACIDVSGCTALQYLYVGKDTIVIGASDNLMIDRYDMP